MKLAIELSSITGLDDLKKRQDEIDHDVKNIDDLIKNKIPDMLKISLKGVTVNKDGVFYNELPLYRLADSLKLRLCTAILKDLFPGANLYVFDGLEKLDKKALTGMIDRSIKGNDVVQYFGSYVGSLSEVNPSCQVWNVEKFELK